MNEFIWPLFCLLSMLLGFFLCYFLIKRTKEKLLDVPQFDVTVQDISEWVKKDQEARRLLEVARRAREKFLAEEK